MQNNVNFHSLNLRLKNDTIKFTKFSKNYLLKVYRFHYLVSLRQRVREHREPSDMAKLTGQMNETLMMNENESTSTALTLFHGHGISSSYIAFGSAVKSSNFSRQEHIYPSRSPTFIIKILILLITRLIKFPFRSMRVGSWENECDGDTKLCHKVG